MGAIVSEITSFAIVYSTVYSGWDQRKHQSSVSLAFVRGIPLRSYNFQAIWRVFRPSSENLVNLNKFLETHSKLRQCSRDDSGQPLDDNISDLEKHLSSAMQERVLQEMQRHYIFYENVKTDYVADFLTALEGYTSTVDSGTITELICLSMLIKWPIVIHLKRSDQHDKCLSLWPDILQDRIPLNLLIEKDLFCPLIYQDAFYDTKELVTICIGKIDLSVLHSICPITVGDLYECLCDSYHNIVLDSSRYKSSSISLYSNPTIAAGVYMRPLPEQTGMIDINHQSLSLDGFGPAKCESDTAETLQSKLFCYVYGKCAFQILQSDIDDCLPGLKIFSAMQCPPTTEKSKFVYLDILDLDANCKETTLRVLSQFANVLNIGKSLKYLVVVGDALSYKQLRYLKDTRPSKFQWLLPYIGDWHTLLNYGHKLMKLYSDAGLKEFVHRCHKGATATAVLEAKSFDKMLNFLLELWEAMFRYQVILFVDSCMQDDPVLTQDISTLFLQWTKKNSVKHSWNKFANDITSLCSALEPVLARFLTFLENKSKDDETFMFWNNFIHRDCLAFIGFYLSLRSGDWDMRNFFLKEMAPFFHIVSSNYYYDLIPKHLADLQCFPQPVINHFKQGGFVANLNGNNWSSVALDEAHEMTINREVKNAITAPTIELFQLKAHYLPYRTKLLKNLFSQLFPSHDLYGQEESARAFMSVSEDNVQHLLEFMQSEQCHLFKSNHTANKTLRHIFSGETPSPENREHMLQYRLLGERNMQEYVKSNVINTSNTIAPSKRKRKSMKVHTFAKKKITKRRQNQIISHMTTSHNMIKRQIDWAIKNNEVPASVEQFITLPMAIAQTNGSPVTGTKSVTREFWETQYPDAFYFGKLPENLFDTCCLVIDGLFIIHTMPTNQKSFLAFTEYLFCKWVINKFSFIPDVSISSIHIVFDAQMPSFITPKSFIQQQRDCVPETESTPTMFNISDSSTLPVDWQMFLRNRENKKRFLQYLYEKFTSFGDRFFKYPQTLVIGGFDSLPAVSVSKGSVTCCPLYNTNHLEADTAIWYHAMQVDARKVVLYSPDNDVYNIGLYLAEKYTDKYFLVCYKLFGETASFMDVTKLSKFLSDNTNLNCFKPFLGMVIMAVYACSGCDYVSFFRYHSKKSFLGTLMDKAEAFIGPSNENDITQREGLLSDIHNHWSSFLAFCRLIGCEYFKICHTSFIRDAIYTAEDLFKRYYCSEHGQLQNHLRWLDLIWKATHSSGKNEEHFLPSRAALELHWMRSCWVCKVWQQADQATMVMPKVEDHGWQLDAEQHLTVRWDSNANIRQVQARVHCFTKEVGRRRTHQGTGLRRLQMGTWKPHWTRTGMMPVNNG